MGLEPGHALEALRPLRSSRRGLPLAPAPRPNEGAERQHGRGGSRVMKQESAGAFDESIHVWQQIMLDVADHVGVMNVDS